MITPDQQWSLPRGNTPVPSRWQATFATAEDARDARMNLTNVVVERSVSRNGAEEGVGWTVGLMSTDAQHRGLPVQPAHGGEGICARHDHHDGQLRLAILSH